MASDHLQFHGHVIFPPFDVIIVQENSTKRELHHVENTQKILNKEEILDLLTVLPSEKIVTVLFLVVTRKCFRKKTPHNNVLQDHVQDLQLHQQDLWIFHNEIPLKLLTTNWETFQNQHTNLKSICKKIKWHMHYIQPADFTICILIRKTKLIQTYHQDLESCSYWIAVPPILYLLFQLFWCLLKVSTVLIFIKLIPKKR